MAKYLDRVIKEMQQYSDMGMPDGEGVMGMGDTSSLGMRGRRSDVKLKAYKLNDILQRRNRAEEEELDMYSMNNKPNVVELKQFFMDTPSPTDEEIADYAEQHGMDLQDMRQAVYALIQSLLPSDDMQDIDSEMGSDMNGDDEIAFSVRSDTGERPAGNEIDNTERF